MEQTPIEIIEEILVEAYDNEDQDAVFAIVSEIRERLQKPDFASDVVDPDDDLDLLADVDEDGEEGDDSGDESEEG